MTATNIKALAAAVDLVAIAVEVGLVTRVNQAVVYARRTPWGRVVPLRTLKSAIVADGMLTYIETT